MTSESISTECIPFAAARKGEESLLRARLALMCELEASLQASRKALLALDLADIECGTRDQIGLTRELEALLQRSRASLAAERSAEPGAPELRTHAAELEEKLQQSQNRIFDALRLQAALLTRARGKLRVLANMLAGPSVPYGPLLARDGGVARLNWTCGERF